MSNQDLIDLLAVAAVVAGSAVCLFGLRIWRFALGGAALTAGLAGGMAFAAARAPHQDVVVIGLGVATGCVLMIAFATLYRMGTMIVFAAIGWYVGLRVGAQMTIDGADLIACAMGGALVAGVIVILVEMPLVMLLSAISGAWLCVWGFSLYFGGGFHHVVDVWRLFEQRAAYRGELWTLAGLAAAGLALQVVGYLRSGPDEKQLAEALNCADLPKQRRIAVLDDLRVDGTITRSEYFHHLVRILSSSSRPMRQGRSST